MPDKQTNRPQLTTDSRLMPGLIRINRAYTEVLADAGTLTESEKTAVLDALQQIEKDSELMPDALDKRLSELAKTGADKLIIARSRNEQLAAALRLWVIEQVDKLTNLLAGLQRAVIEQAEGHVATLMPGYLNARPVQAVSCAHWLLSYFWMLARDQERLSSVIGRASSSPLGSGLLAGIGSRIDRHDLAHRLDFGGQSENSIDSVSDLDFGAEFLFAATLISTHLNRLADDLLLFNHPALGFVTLDPEHTGGSPISRHDSSSETVEQINGRSGQLLGKMTGFLAAFRTLPSTFTAETPDSRAAIFDASDLLMLMIETLEGAVSTLTIHPDRMWDALNENVLASDLVEYLVSRGETYDKAATAIEKLLGKAETTGKPIAETELATLQKESNFFDADVFGYLDHSRSAAQRATIGGTAPAAIRTQIRQAMNWLVEAGLE